MNEFLPLVYIAGPITIPDPIWNTNKAILIADELYRTKICVPLVPHANLVWHLICPHPVDYWYEYDMHILKRCEAVLRLPGKSVGADAEVVQAKQWGIPVFLLPSALKAWVEENRVYDESNAVTWWQD